MARRLIAAVSAALGLVAASSASAGCTFQVLPIPVTLVGARPTVSVRIGGKERHFLLDSGSFTNAISNSLASEQNLLVVSKDRKSGIIGTRTISGLKGEEIKVPIVGVPALEFLGTAFANQSFVVSDQLDGLDGLLGQPMLRRMDVEYDLRGGVIRLVKTDGCKDTDVVYWVRPGQAYFRMALAWSDQGNSHTGGSIYINGQKMLARFDTGATSSFITRAAAARAGVKVTDSGVTRIGKVSGLDGQVDSWVGTFADVMIGNEEIKDAPLAIADSGSHAFDVLIGADFFTSHHVYVSKEQSQALFAYNGGPVFRPPEARPAPPPPVRLPSNGLQATQTQSDPLPTAAP